MARPPPFTVELTVEAEFEECLEFSWKVVSTSDSSQDAFAPRPKDSLVEMVIDRSDGDKQVSKPPPNAMVKTVGMGRDLKASLQNMPEGRKFFIAVVVTLPSGEQLRSSWARATTLDPKARETHLGNLDPMNKPRLNCRSCPCTGYVPLRWTQFIPIEQLRCRRCGCRCETHVAVDVFDILQGREERARTALQRKSLTPLPAEALEWDDRECVMWFLTEGAVHPRQAPPGAQASQQTPAMQEKWKTLGGPEGPRGRPGCVSIVTPTIESRQRFHELLWKCFEAQKWPDKELVVIETYEGRKSPVFERLAEKGDSRLVYIPIKRPFGEDWSIGLKRNVGIHFASGEFIANFDDDDLYAPNYVSTMVKELEARRGAHLVTLSSWFVMDVRRQAWYFCDAIVWGLARGKDDKAPEVRSWAYGYGFSYVHRRQAALEVTYEDRNMGEDFSFVGRLMLLKGDRAAQLVHDGFGICAHTQHGANTSETFPIREVAQEEARCLDVAELLKEPGFPWPPPGLSFAWARTPDGQLDLVDLEQHRQRSRDVRVYPPPAWFPGAPQQSSAVSGFVLPVKFGATAKDLVHFAGIRVEQCKRPNVCVLMVPPSGRMAQLQRQKTAAEVLGVASMIEQIRVSPEDIQDEPRRLQLLVQWAEKPLRPDERLPLTLKEFWLGEVSPTEEAETPGNSFSSTASGSPASQPKGAEPKEDELMVVQVSSQASSVKQYFSARRSVQAMLPHGSTVSFLRQVLGPDLPAGARVLAEASAGKSGSSEKARTTGEAELTLLAEEDPLPLKVTVSDFCGRRSLYLRFTKDQCGRILLLLKDILSTPAMQKRLDEAEVEAKGDSMEYRLRLTNLLLTEAYPQVCRRFGLPCEGVDSLRAIPAGLHLVEHHLDLCEMQLEVEKLMRNRLVVPMVEARIALMKHHLAMMHAAPPPPDGHAAAG